MVDFDKYQRFTATTSDTLKTGVSGTKTMWNRIAALSFLLVVGMNYSVFADIVDDCRENPISDVRLRACDKIISSVAYDLNTKAIAYQYRGNARVEAGAFQQAAQDFSTSIDLNPNSSPAYAGRARAKFSLRDFRGAVADFTIALKFSPNASELYIERGHVYLLLGNFDASITDLTRAISVEPNSASAFNNRGLAFRRKGLLDNALRDYTTAIEINPAYALAYANRGYLLLAIGQRSAAIEDFRRSVVLDSTQVGARNELRALKSESPIVFESDRLVAQGRDLAERNCSGCHSVAVQGKSPNNRAPEFRILKRRHALIALRQPIARGIAAPHDTMPQFSLTEGETDAIIAFINSLPVSR